MLRILMCIDSFEVGGVTEVVKKLYSNINKEKFSIDFLVMRRLDSDFEKEVIKNGSDVFYMTELPLNNVPLLNYHFRNRKYLAQARRLIKYKKYDVAHIHAHLNSFTFICTKLKIPFILLHAHEAVSDFNGNENKSKLMGLLWKTRQRQYNKYAAVLAGDSMKACFVKYGESSKRVKDFKVLHPPIDTERFNPESFTFEDAVKTFSVDDGALNLLHVGRLSPVKNQSFIIDITAQINKSRDCHFFLVGEGDCKQSLISHAKKLGVSDKVHFLPADTSPLIYKAMDAFVFPSFSEAFGMVGVESQLMGVPCFASTNIPNDIDVGLCEFLKLEDGATVWADSIIKYCSSEHKNTVDITKFKVETLIKNVEEIYSSSEYNPERK